MTSKKEQQKVALSRALAELASMPLPMPSEVDALILQAEQALRKARGLLAQH